MTFVPDLWADPRIFFAAAAALLSFAAFFFYLRDMLVRETRPQRASWLIWSVLSSIACATQVAEGATGSLIYVIMNCTGTLIVFCYALRRGVGSILYGKDVLILGVAACGLGLWTFTETSAWALAITCGISLLAGAVTCVKALAAPQTETPSYWVLSFAAACAAIGSIGDLNPILLAYPAYLFVLNGAVFMAIRAGRARKSQEALARAQARQDDASRRAAPYPFPELVPAN